MLVSHHFRRHWFSFATACMIVAAILGGRNNTLLGQSPAPALRLKHEGAVRGVAFIDAGKQLATGCLDAKSVRLWDLSNGKETRAFNQPADGCYFIAGSPDGKLLAATGADAVVYLLNSAGGVQLLKGHEKPASCAAFSPDGKLLATAGQDNTVRLWEMPSGKEVGQLKEVDAVNALAFSPDGKLLAVGGWFLPVHLWDVASKKNIRQCVGHREPVLTLAFAPDGKILATGSLDRSLRLWEVLSGKEIYQIDEHPAQVNAVAYAPNGRYVASACVDRTVRLWEIAGGKEVRRFNDHQGPAFSVAFAPAGDRLASGSSDQFALVWNMKDLAQASPTKSVPLTKSRLDQHWQNLARANPRTAFRSLWALQLVPVQTIPLLKERLLPFAELADRERIKQTMNDLNSEKSAVREKAAQDLEKLGELSEPLLRKALSGFLPSLQARRRIERILEKVQASKSDGAASDAVRALRSVMILEAIATVEARQVLEKLAQGMPEAALSQDAQAALARLTKK